MDTIRQLAENEQAPMDLMLLADPAEAVIETYIHQSDCYVMERGGQIVGVYLLQAIQPDAIELVNIAVDENMQGQGLGKKLVNHAIRTSKNNGYRMLTVCTGNSSLGQLALYQKCGFRMVGIETDYFVKHYSEPIYENGIQCRDRIILQMDLHLT